MASVEELEALRTSALGQVLGQGGRGGRMGGEGGGERERERARERERDLILTNGRMDKFVGQVRGPAMKFVATALNKHRISEIPKRFVARARRDGLACWRR